MTAYDTNNVFAKILRGEIPCKKVYEDDTVLAFADIAPAAPVHVLVVPKTEGYRSFEDFTAKAPPPLISAFFASVRKTAETLKLADYRLITNHGEEAGQSVFHFHVHILGGRPLGGLLPHS
jgi:diadenosine tetraphosphate (Ap4A) HIT family hydrolase